jgi:tetratricopeptide (TPR) repeat protein
LNPTRAVPFAIRAGAKDALGDFDGAIADYDRASALHPTGATSFEYDGDETSAPTIKVLPIDEKSGFAFTLRRDPYVERRALALAGRAITIADRTIARDPGNSAAYSARGLAKSVRSDFDGAVADLNRAITLDPKNAAAFRNRGLVHETQGHFSEVFSHEGNVISQATAAIRRNENDAPAYIARGAYLANRGEYDPASADFARAIALNPEYPGVFIHRGLVRKHLGDSRAALADFNHAIALADRQLAEDPGNAHAFANRANAKMETGDLPGAIADFDRAFALDAADADILFNRGLAKDRRGDHVGALADFNQANIVNSPSLRRFHRIERTAQSINEVVDYTFLEPGIFGLRGAFRYEQGDGAGGIEDISRALALVIDEYDRFARRASPGIKESRLGRNGSPTETRQDDRFINRGASRFEKSNHDQAVADYNRAVALDPTDPDAFFFRGVVRQDAHEENDALSDYDHAIALNAKHAEALANRGIIRSERGDHAGAIADYDRVIALLPSDVSAYDARSIFKRRQGDDVGAKADMSFAFHLVKDHPGDPLFGMFTDMRRPSALAFFMAQDSRARTAPVKSSSTPEMP